MNFKNRSVTLPRSLFSLLTTPTFIDHLKLTFVAAKPLPAHVFEQVTLAAAEGRAEYFLDGAAGMDLVLSREEMLPN